MKKIKKIKIRINGKLKMINANVNLLKFVKSLKIPLKKVAIEVNNKIMDKKKLNRKIIKENDKIEIVHFIGGG